MELMESLIKEQQEMPEDNVSHRSRGKSAKLVEVVRRLGPGLANREIIDEAARAGLPKPSCSSIALARYKAGHTGHPGWLKKAKLSRAMSSAVQVKPTTTGAVAGALALLADIRLLAIKCGGLPQLAELIDELAAMAGAGKDGEE